MTKSYYIVVTRDYCWGRGITLTEAKSAAREAGSRMRKWIAYRIEQPADAPPPYFEGLGISHYGKMEEVEVV